MPEKRQSKHGIYRMCGMLTNVAFIGDMILFLTLKN